jgi:sugar lactone lactonase YvrE
VPVSIFRVTPQGARESFSSGVVNPTSMAFDEEGRLYISSRFEGIVYRLDADGSAAPFASDLGVVCGLAFARDGRLFAGDRSGTIFAVSPEGKARPFASLPSSVAAFHLAFAPDGTLFVTGPTLATYDAVYAIDPEGAVQVRTQQFGRPQGLAVDSGGELYVTDALAGASGLYRVAKSGDPELMIAGPGLIGVALDADGGFVVCSNDTAYRLPGVV